MTGSVCSVVGTYGEENYLLTDSQIYIKYEAQTALFKDPGRTAQ